MATKRYAIRNMKPNKQDIHSILFITLSNLGDIILTTPVLEEIHKNFPDAAIDVITGPPGEKIFTAHPGLRNVSVQHKHRSFANRVRQFMELRKKKYDLVVDLKGSILPFVLGTKYRPDMLSRKKEAIHKKDEHLYKIRGIVEGAFTGQKFFIPITKEDKKSVEEMLADDGRGPRAATIVINPGAKSHLKRWSGEKYASLIRRLTDELKCRVFITGNDDDINVTGNVMASSGGKGINMCSRTSVGELAELVRRADVMVTNDSAPLHIASAMNTPTVAIFGPSDDVKYGPLSKNSVVLKPAVPCRPCGKALCSVGPDEGCISQVSVEDVFNAVKGILGETIKDKG